MKLKIQKLRTPRGEWFFCIDRRIFPFGYETLYRYGRFVFFSDLTWAKEYIRLYNAIKKKK